MIRVEGLGKKYTIGHQAGARTLREKIQDFSTGFLKSRSARTSEDFWALREIDFDVRQGEALGIIGRNGAGKSTLLKILSRITEPTEGRVTIRGHVASLLEVGTGFHPELSGRENIALNGAILGMSRKDIARKFDDIVSFAEVEKFIDTPVKRYSSGMYVRLAFAVAAHLDPEILIVDEVLAVGDVQFQQKCLGKMRDVSKGEGRTVLFVSHNMAAIQNLCQTAILLDGGRVAVRGSAQQCVSEYLRFGTQAKGEVLLETNSETELRLERVATLNPAGIPSAQHNLSEGVTVEIDYQLEKAVRGAQVAFELWNDSSICVFCSTDFDGDPARINGEKRAGEHRVRCTIPPNLLRPGSYTLNISSSIPNNRHLDEALQAIRFDVVDDGSILIKLSQGRSGTVLPILPWKETP